jgi:alkaline phosphatase D
MKFVVSLVVFILLLSSPGYGQPKDIPYVILISFDGFRYDYAEKFDAPFFKSLRKRGAWAEGLIPSFPSKTFPNHYSIITGLYPGHHGLVDNNFYDPEREEFYAMKDLKRKNDPYYYGGVPLWRLARQHGIKTASFFWVGSELPQTDLHPDFYYPYDESIPDTTRIQQVINWLNLPEKERPHFITLYFSSPDHEGHTYGPSSEETKKAVLRSDYILEQLVKGLQRIDLPVNVVIVSDHGMEELKQQADTYIFLDEILNRKDTSIKVANGGTQAHIYIKDVNKRESIFKSLKASEKNFMVYKQADFPKRWHYNTPRSGDLLITANPGSYIVDQERKKFLSSIKPGTLFGAHGYDPQRLRSMMGIFYALGPDIAEGKSIAPFENIHVYPFIASLLKLPTPAIDGDEKVLQKIIRH